MDHFHVGFRRGLSTERAWAFHRAHEAANGNLVHVAKTGKEYLLARL